MPILFMLWDTSHELGLTHKNLVVDSTGRLAVVVIGKLRGGVSIPITFGLRFRQGKWRISDGVLGHKCDVLC
jgi:hypothetical protein